MRIPGYKPTPDDVHKLAELIKQNQGSKVGGDQGTDKAGGTQSTNRKESTGCFGHCRKGICKMARVAINFLKNSLNSLWKSIPEYKVQLSKPGEPQFKNPNREGRAGFR